MTNLFSPFLPPSFFGQTLPPFLPYLPFPKTPFLFSFFFPSIHPSISIIHLSPHPSQHPPSLLPLLPSSSSIPLFLFPFSASLHPVHYVYTFFFFLPSRPAYSAFSRLFHINIHGPHTYFSGTHIFRSRETTFFIFQHSTWKKTRIPCVWGAIAPSKKAASSPLARDCGMFNGKYPLPIITFIPPLFPQPALNPSHTFTPRANNIKKGALTKHTHDHLVLMSGWLQVWYHSGIKEIAHPPPCGDSLRIGQRLHCRKRKGRGGS
ncbi:MAG: hypothetical protein BYD32DRAFT_297804 [Podila humilis]|nr:MAG: hypothetical protein BYD32DRAFT_297804 [Podila humilis]